MIHDQAEAILLYNRLYPLPRTHVVQAPKSHQLGGWGVSTTPILRISPAPMMPSITRQNTEAVHRELKKSQNDDDSADAFERHYTGSSTDSDSARQPQQVSQHDSDEEISDTTATSSEVLISRKVLQPRVLPVTLLTLSIKEDQQIKDLLFAAHNAESKFKECEILLSLDLTVIRNQKLCEAIQKKLADFIKDSTFLQLAAAESEPVKQQLFDAQNANYGEDLFRILSRIDLDALRSDLLKLKIKRLIACLT